MKDNPMCFVVTDDGIPRGVFLVYAEAVNYKDRHGSPHWRMHQAPYYG